MGAEGGAARGGGGCGRAPAPLISSESGRRSAAVPRPPSPPSGAAGRCPPRTEPSSAASAAAPRGGTCGAEERPGCRAEVSEPGGGQGPAVPGAAGELSVCSRPAGLRRAPTGAPPATRPGRAGPGTPAGSGSLRGSAPGSFWPRRNAERRSPAPTLWAFIRFSIELSRIFEERGKLRARVPSAYSVPHDAAGTWESETLMPSSSRL